MSARAASAAARAVCGVGRARSGPRSAAPSGPRRSRGRRPACRRPSTLSARSTSTSIATSACWSPTARARPTAPPAPRSAADDHDDGRPTGRPARRRRRASDGRRASTCEFPRQREVTPPAGRPDRYPGARWRRRTNVTNRAVSVTGATAWPPQASDAVRRPDAGARPPRHAGGHGGVAPAASAGDDGGTLAAGAVRRRRAPAAERGDGRRRPPPDRPPGGSGRPGAARPAGWPATTDAGSRPGRPAQLHHVVEAERRVDRHVVGGPARRSRSSVTGSRPSSPRPARAATTTDAGYSTRPEVRQRVAHQAPVRRSTSSLRLRTRASACSPSSVHAAGLVEAQARSSCPARRPSTRTSTPPIAVDQRPEPVESTCDHVVDRDADLGLDRRHQHRRARSREAVDPHRARRPGRSTIRSRGSDRSDDGAGAGVEAGEQDRVDAAAGRRRRRRRRCRAPGPSPARRRPPASVPATSTRSIWSGPPRRPGRTGRRRPTTSAPPPPRAARQPAPAATPVGPRSTAARRNAGAEARRVGGHRDARTWHPSSGVGGGPGSRWPSRARSAASPRWACCLTAPALQPRARGDRRPRAGRPGSGGRRPPAGGGAAARRAGHRARAARHAAGSTPRRRPRRGVAPGGGARPGGAAPVASAPTRPRLRHRPMARLVVTRATQASS